LLLSQEHLPLLIILAYRDNEVDSTHPLTKLIDTARENAPQCVREVHLRPLATIHVQQLLVDTLRCNEEKAAPLAQLVHAKTQGNPFFIGKLLQTWHSSGLLSFDYAAGEWRWSLSSLRASPVADDVVAVLSAQMATLTPAAQTLLQYAACSGNTYSLFTLSHITQLSMLRLVRAACECEAAGLVNTVSHAQDLLLLRQTLEKEHEKTGREAGEGVEGAETSQVPTSPTRPQSVPGVSPNYSMLSGIIQRFQHDRIQSAAFALIPPAQLSSVHCTIASQLLQSLEEEEALAEYASDIAAHINSGFFEPTQRQRQSVSESEQQLAQQQGSSHSINQPAGDGTLLPSAFDEATQRQWESFFAQSGMMERVVQMEITAAQQASASAIYDAAIRFLSAALFLLDMSHAADHSLLPDEPRVRAETAV